MKAFLLTLLVVLSGCATRVVPLEIPGIERSEQLRTTDLRPPVENQGEIFSLLITSDAYAVYRIAGTASTPSAVRLLQHRAYERTGEPGPVDLKVHHLVVYRNSQAEFRRGAIGAGIGGVLGALLAGQSVTDPSGAVSSLVDADTFASLAATEYKRALYSEQENPGSGSVYIVFIETEMNGKRMFTRTLTPTKVKAQEEPLANALEASIKFHLSQY